MATITQTVSPKCLEEIANDQFLAQEFDVVDELNRAAQKQKYEPKYVPRNIAIFAALHVGAFIGFYQLFFVAKWQTVAWSLGCWFLSGLGITAGAHRLWAHKSYKARLPLRVFLMLMNCMAFQNDVIEWSRDHRCHHKWTDTDADPHNVNRGFFFSHVGWLLQKKHPKIKEMGGKLDLSDLLADPVLAFQRKHYLPLVAIWCFLIPTVVAVYGWGESAFVAFYTAALWRYCWTLHATWFINSAAHMFGYRPYDAKITPTESIVTTLTAFGEGGHNYHHTFPQDYRTSEMPWMLNLTRVVLDFFSAIGLVYDRKTVNDEIIQRQMAKYGDGSLKAQ
uniref:FA_desaturase domain-containing protein n=1 Tax=Panagrellus redivivus TaxID=6233 RepID=A0A7E4VKY1_PANRE